MQKSTRAVTGQARVLVRCGSESLCFSLTRPVALTNSAIATEMHCDYNYRMLESKQSLACTVVSKDL